MMDGYYFCIIGWTDWTNLGYHNILSEYLFAMN